MIYLANEQTKSETLSECITPVFYYLLKQSCWLVSRIIGCISLWHRPCLVQSRKVFSKENIF